MQRLNFTYSVDINRQLIGTVLDLPSITFNFFTAYQKRIFNWHFDFIYHEIPHEYNISSIVMKPNSNSIEDPFDALPTDCTCKFTLKRTDHTDLEYISQGHKDGDPYVPRFLVPNDHPIYNFFVNLVKNPKEQSAVLVMDLELPKNLFVVKFPSDMKIAPDGWENDTSYKILTIEDKHDFHFVCKDGVLYAKKRDWAWHFSDSFKNELKDKCEVKMDISKETMKSFTAFLFTNAFVVPKKWNPEILAEFTENDSKFNRGEHLSERLDIFSCRELNDTSISLRDLISWWKPADSRLKSLIVFVANTRFYSEIMTHYKPDAKFTDHDKKEIHKMLHEKISRKFFKEDFSLYNKIIQFHSWNQMMVVTEVQESNDKQK